MPTSEARILANQRNAVLSTGPLSTIGKQNSRKNALKHGLSGSGVVIADEDFAEVERRNGALQDEMGPQSELGSLLVLEIAVVSVRMQRATRQEFAASAERDRHAAENFDEERFTKAEALFDTLHENPRATSAGSSAPPRGSPCLSKPGTT